MYTLVLSYIHYHIHSHYHIYTITYIHYQYCIYTITCREKAVHPLQYSCLENPTAEEPGGLQSMRSLRVGHD